MNVELLQRVKQHILEKPNRFLMADWIVRQRDSDERTYVDDRDERVEFAECGTAACVAGWSCLLGGRPDTLAAPREARELLGLEYQAAESLFYADSWPEKFRLRYEAAATHEEQVRVAAERIDHFIATGD